MKRILKTVALILAVICVCLAFSACGVKYNAQVVSPCEFTSEFLQESITYGAWRENEDYDPEDETSKYGWYDEDSPKTRVYTVREQDEADKVFLQVPETDFNRQMFVIYCWTETNVRKVVLKTVKKDKNGDLKITFTLKKKGGWWTADATMPQRRILVIQMDKVDFTSAQFTKIK